MKYHLTRGHLNMGSHITGWESATSLTREVANRCPKLILVGRRPVL